MGNRDRILETSIELFNMYGAAQTGTNKIAAHLNISPGNLYYHFKNKEEIIRTIFPEISRETDAVFEFSTELASSPDLFGDILMNWVAVVWKYRFFYGDLVSLLRNDSDLKGQYNKRRERTLGLIQQGILAYSSAYKTGGRIFSDEEAKKLAINIWIVALNWIRFLQVEHDDEQITQTDLVAGAFQILALLEPYLDVETSQKIHGQMVGKINTLTKNSA